jgi:antitoxin VapB
MALSIKHPEADGLARELANLTHLSITDAVLTALREQLRRETGRRTSPRIREELLRISDYCAGLPDLDPRSAEEIIGFDECGIPV